MQARTRYHLRGREEGQRDMEEENGKGRDGQRRQPSCKRNGRGQRTRGVKRGREGNEKGGLKKDTTDRG